MIQKELNKKHCPDLSNPEKEGYYLNPYVQSEFSVRKSVKVAETRAFYGIKQPELDLSNLRDAVREARLVDLLLNF